MDAGALGRYLRETREAKEITLAEAEQALRIRRRTLEAFEIGDFGTSDLSIVQIRGFVRNYARFLGLDEELVVGYYESARTAQQAEKPRRNRRETRQEPAHSTQEAPVAARSITDTDPTLPPVPLGERLEQRRRNRLMTLNRLVMGLVTLAALSVIGLVSWELLQSPSSAVLDDIVTLPPIIAADTETPTLTPLPSFTPAVQQGSIRAARAPIEQTDYNGQGVYVSVRMAQRTWIRFEADGTEQFAGIAPPDAELEYWANETVNITASNAEALVVTFNGVPQRVFGDRGQRVDLEFTADGVQVSSGTNFDPTAEFTNTPLPTPSLDVGALIEAQTPSATPGPSQTPSPTLIPSDTPTITATPSDTPTVTATPTQTNTPGPSPTNTLSPTPTLTPTITLTPTPTITATPTAILPLRVTPENLPPTKDGA